MRFGFFSDITANELTDNFGMLSCFRFEGEQTWIVVGSGIPTTSDGVTPGGSMIATETCDSSDSVCLDPDAEHSFTEFEVSYPPKPDSAPGKVMGTFGGRLLYFSDAYCGLFVFDLRNGQWYPNGSVSDLMNGAGVTSVASPPSVNGVSALSSAAPARQGYANER